jgi:hypothetical protein
MHPSMIVYIIEYHPKSTTIFIMNILSIQHILSRREARYFDSRTRTHKRSKLYVIHGRIKQQERSRIILRHLA